MENWYKFATEQVSTQNTSSAATSYTYDTPAINRPIWVWRRRGKYSNYRWQMVSINFYYEIAIASSWCQYKSNRANDCFLCTYSFILCYILTFKFIVWSLFIVVSFSFFFFKYLTWITSRENWSQNLVVYVYRYIYILVALSNSTYVINISTCIYFNISNCMLICMLIFMFYFNIKYIFIICFIVINIIMCVFYRIDEDFT